MQSDGPSPAQLLFGRRLKGLLPVTEKLLLPKVTPKPEQNNKNIKTKSYYNKSAKDLPELHVNDRVIVSNINNNNKWKKGTIIKLDKERPRSYYVRLDANGKIYIRNRRFIKKVDNLPYDDNELFEAELENIINDFNQSPSQNENSNNSLPVKSDSTKEQNVYLPANCNSSDNVVRKSSRTRKLPQRFVDFRM